MNVFRLLALLAALCIASPAFSADPAPSAPAATEPQAPAQALLGMWEEQSPTGPGNVVQFLPDHTARVYLTKFEGEAANVHSIPMTWEMAGDSVLSVTATASAQPRIMQWKLAFENGAMVLTDVNGASIRHVRVETLPERFNW